MKRLPLLAVLILMLGALYVPAQDRAQDAPWENYFGAGMRALNADDLPKAELLFKTARLKAELEQEAGNPKAIDMRLASNNGIAVVLRAEGKSVEAEEVLREQLDLLKSSGRREDDPQLSTTLHNLGLVLFDEQKYEDARRVLEQAVALRRKYDPEPQRNVAVSLLSLGGAYFHEGKIKEAEAAALEARRILAQVPDERKTSDDLAAVMRSDHNLALIYVEQRKYSDAETYYKRAIASMEKLYGQTSPGLVNYLSNYAKLLRILKRDAEAKALEVRIEIIRKQNN
jgi:tetratricopeptide (TPR) repeat protein